MIFRVRLAVRFLVVLLVITRHALPAAVHAALAAMRSRAAAGAVLRRRARRLAVALGPSYVKGAQLLSTRRDVLPPAWCEVLGELHDQVPPMSPRSARAALRTAFGDPSPVEIDCSTVRSGSIACVYRGTVPTGQVVAVKIRRPRVRQKIELDFALMRGFAGLLGRLPRLRDLPAVAVIDQIGGAVAQQADLALEAESLLLLREALGDLGFLRIPKPIGTQHADGVLLMEFVDGLRQVDPASLPAPERAELVRRVLRCAYRMLFLHGLVHCDMHPGNLYLGGDGKIVLLDAGFVVRLEPAVRRLFAEFFLYLARGDGAHCAEVVRRSASAVAPTADLAGFRAGITELVAESTGRPAAEFSLVRFATRLFDLQQRHGLFAAAEFVFPLLALLVLEGRINDLDASTDFQAEAIPVLTTAIMSGVLMVGPASS